MATKTVKKTNRKKADKQYENGFYHPRVPREKWESVQELAANAVPRTSGTAMLELVIDLGIKAYQEGR